MLKKSSKTALLKTRPLQQVVMIPVSNEDRIRKLNQLLLSGWQVDYQEESGNGAVMLVLSYSGDRDMQQAMRRTLENLMNNDKCLLDLFH